MDGKGGKKYTQKEAEEILEARADWAVRARAALLAWMVLIRSLVGCGGVAFGESITESVGVQAAEAEWDGSGESMVQMIKDAATGEMTFRRIPLKK